MRLLLTILLIGLPLAEIATFIQVGQWLGLGPTLALVLLAGLAGILLIRHQSLATLGAVRAALARNQVPAAELADAACVLIAGFLCNLAIRRVPDRLYMTSEELEAEQRLLRQAAPIAGAPAGRPTAAEGRPAIVASAWIMVGAPLLWGITSTLGKALLLFG